MTKDQDFTIPVNTKVALKNEVADELYSFAFGGSEGWIRSRMHDHMGYPLVFIEWDKDHWAYNGEPDRWAFEKHFEPVEDEDMSDDSIKKEELVKAFGPLADLLGLSGIQPNPQPGATEEDAGVSPEADQQYKESLAAAIEVAQGADSFLLMTVSSGDDAKQLIPHVFNAYKTTESGTLLESQLSALAAEAHQMLAIKEIRRHLSEDKE